MKSKLKFCLESPEFAAAFMLLILLGVFQYTSGGIFFSEFNLEGILNIAPEMLLVATGVTLLMICGEFDLSVGSVFAFTPMLIVILLNEGFPLYAASFIGIFTAGLIGALNGYLSLTFSLPSFITTLGMLFIIRSLTIIISGGFPPSIPDETPLWIFNENFGFFRISMLWFIVIFILLWILLEKTNLGNHIRAAGGQPESAGSLGVSIHKTKIICFMICSCVAGLAGALQVFRLGSPLPSLGEGMELQAVASAVIGGTALSGGVGSIIGGVIGALLIRVIDNGMVLSQIDANWFKFAVGSLTILSVIFNGKLRKWGRQIQFEKK